MKNTFIIILLIAIPIVFITVRKSTNSQVENPNIAKGVGDKASNLTAIPTEESLIPKEMCLETCVDCSLYPVNKDNSLRSDYVPTVIATGLAGGREILPEIKDSLTKMFEDAKSQGINLNIASGYRSYQTQSGLFNSYVNKELSANPALSYDQAVAKANTYSAKPGHSEHQLGTTLDLTCIGCAPFQNDASNQKVYSYIEANAYKFGFVVSYPNGTIEETGYKYEPWHIRYIGEELAEVYLNENINNNPKQPLEAFIISECEKNI